MKNKKSLFGWVFVVAAIFLGERSFAAPQEVVLPPAEASLPMAQEPAINSYTPGTGSRIYISGGLTFSPSSDYNVLYKGDSLGTSNSKDKGGPWVSLEFERRFAGEYAWLRPAVSLEWSQYAYKDNSPKDQQLAVMLLPRLGMSSGKAFVWFAPGFGAMNTSLGSASESVDGLTVSADDTSYLAFAWSLRAGVDVVVDGNTSLGFQLGYSSWAATVPVTLSSGTATAKLDYSVNRSQFFAAVRVGFGD